MARILRNRRADKSISSEWTFTFKGSVSSKINNFTLHEYIGYGVRAQRWRRRRGRRIMGEEKKLLRATDIDQVSRSRACVIRAVPAATSSANKDITREREEKWVGNAAINIRINKCKSVRRGRARAGPLHVQSGRNKCKSRVSENGTLSNKIFERYFGARQRKNGQLNGRRCWC
jgi:hypothetical protein